MCSLGRCARISFQSHTRSVFFSSRAKSSSSCSCPVGCNLRIFGEQKALKFQSFRRSFGDSSSRFSDKVCSRNAVPDAEGVEYAETIHGFSYNGDSPKSRDSIDAYRASFGDDIVKREVDIMQEARNSAIGFLASRAITVAELRKKLNGKKFPRKVVESVIADLRNRGMVNDEFYAESFSRSRWLASTWGPLRIKKALLGKGVSEEYANKATAQVFEEEDPDAANPDELCDISQISLDHLFTQASKQWLRYQNKSLEKKKSTMIRWLQYRGFSWVTIKVILTKLESECRPHDASCTNL